MIVKARPPVPFSLCQFGTLGPGLWRIPITIRIYTGQTDCPLPRVIKQIKQNPIKTLHFIPSLNTFDYIIGLRSKSMFDAGVDIVQAGGSGGGGKIYSFLRKIGKIY